MSLDFYIAKKDVEPVIDGLKRPREFPAEKRCSLLSYNQQLRRRFDVLESKAALAALIPHRPHANPFGKCRRRLLGPRLVQSWEGVGHLSFLQSRSRLS
jgi:hypothetical protein